MSAVAAAKREELDNPYDLIGGADGVRRLVDRFYDIMDVDPRAAELKAMHAADLGPMRERLFDYLSGWLGGPPRYFARQDAKCIRSAHAPFAIGTAERDQWMACMRQALDESSLPGTLRAQVEAAFSRIANMLVNR